MPGICLPARDRSRSPGRVRAPLAAAGWLVALTAVAADAPPRPTDRLLAVPLHAVWSDVALRDWVNRVTSTGSTSRAAVVLDGRVDPDTRVSITCRGEPLADVVDRVATEAGAAVDVLETTIRIVPRDRAGIAMRAELARQAALAKLPATRRRVIDRRAALHWPAGATPRHLARSAAEAVGVELDGLDAIPHDHLPAATLPPLSLGERLDLLLADYDLRIDWGRDGGRVVPIDTGLDGIAAPPRPPRPATGPAAAVATRRFTLRLAAPLDEAVAALAPQFGLRGRVDRESLAARGIQPGEIVRLDVRDATRDELFDAVVTPLRLRWRIDADELVIDAPAE